MITKKNFLGVDTWRKRSIISLVALERGKRSKRAKSFKTQATSEIVTSFRVY